MSEGGRTFLVARASAVVVHGDPGFGKSTLTLATTTAVATADPEVNRPGGVGRAKLHTCVMPTYDLPGET